MKYRFSGLPLQFLAFFLAALLLAGGFLSGFVAAYEKEEIKFYVNSTPVHGALVSTYDENGVAQLVMLTNSPEVTLPETGGPGTILYTTGGLLLMMAAFLLLLHNQTKKRRKEEIPSF